MAKKKVEKAVDGAAKATKVRPPCFGSLLFRRIFVVLNFSASF